MMIAQHRFDQRAVEDRPGPGPWRQAELETRGQFRREKARAAPRLPRDGDAPDQGAFLAARRRRGVELRTDKGDVADGLDVMGLVLKSPDRYGDYLPVLHGRFLQGQSYLNWLPTTKIF